MYMYIYMYLTPTYTYVQMTTITNAYIHKHNYNNENLRTHIQTYLRIHTYIHKHTHTHMRAHTHTHTHTHTDIHNLHAYVRTNTQFQQFVTDKKQSQVMWLVFRECMNLTRAKHVSFPNVSVSKLRIISRLRQRLVLVQCGCRFKPYSTLNFHNSLKNTQRPKRLSWLKTSVQSMQVSIPRLFNRALNRKYMIYCRVNIWNVFSRASTVLYFANIKLRISYWGQ